MTTTAAAPTLTHQSILASAGAGKTFQLTRRYLQLLAAGAAPSSILASSFTRAAAGEIRDRILGRLAKAVDDDAERAALGADLGRPDLSVDTVLELLELLARNLHRLQVRTLDSFFASIVKSFALELGISPGATIVSEDVEAQLRRDAIRDVLDAEPSDELTNLLRSLTQGSSDKAVTRTIEQVVDALHDTALDAAPGAWTYLAVPPGGSRDDVAAAIDAMAAQPVPGTFEKARAADVARAQAEEWLAFISTGVAAKIVNGSLVFSRTPVPADVVAAYQPVIDHAAAELLGRIARRNEATGRLLGLYRDRHERLKQKHHAMTFADVTAACGAAESLGRLEEICYRLDAVIAHMLLDEMQDTSMLQWRALAPFARELVSHRPPERSFFCVGDVKQSIYGWRNAVPEILQSMPDLLRGPDGSSAVAVDTLAKSWRSSPTIMEAVNLVFDDLGHVAPLAEWSSVTDEWRTMFETHDTVKKTLPGRVELWTAPVPGADDGLTTNEARYRAAAERAAALHHAMPAASIGILTRSNAAVARIIFELDRLGVAASERGGMPLTNAPSVGAVLDLLLLADHPDDTIAAFNVARGPLGAAVGLTDHADDDRRRAVAARVRRRLMELGYAGTIARLVRSIAAACNDREMGRLLQLVDLAGRFDPRATLRPAEFVAFVEIERIADATPSTVSVMTVHQSKGLEFDHVILPELEGRLTGRGQDPFISDRDNATGEVTAVCGRIDDWTLRLAPPHVQALFARHRHRTVREALCTLYVAMTRARQGLFMIVDPPTVTKKGEITIPLTHAGVLRAALAPTAVDPDTCHFALGTIDWMAAAGGVEVPAEAPEPARPRLAASTGSTPVAAPSPSAHAGAATLDGRLAVGDDEALRRGEAIHALFELVEWIEHFEPDPDELRAVVAAIAPRRDGAWVQRQVDGFLGMIERPEIRDALRRGDRDPGAVTVDRERSFARLVDGALQRGTIDRLVIERDGGAIAGATIYDFKTDDIPAGAAAARAETYRSQLEAYRAAMSEQLGLDPARIGMVLVFCTPGVEVGLGGSDGATKRRSDEG